MTCPSCGRNRLTSSVSDANATAWARSTGAGIPRSLAFGSGYNRPDTTLFHARLSPKARHRRMLTLPEKGPPAVILIVASDDRERTAVLSHLRRRCREDYDIHAESSTASALLRLQSLRDEDRDVAI